MVGKVTVEGAPDSFDDVWTLSAADPLRHHNTASSNRARARRIASGLPPVGRRSAIRSNTGAGAPGRGMVLAAEGADSCAGGLLIHGHLDVVRGAGRVERASVSPVRSEDGYVLGPRRIE